MKKIIALLLISAGLTGCGGVGSLVSNDRVTDADNDQVVTIGDSIFALSGKIQDILEDYAGETFRQYTISGAEVTGGIYATDIATQFEIAKSDNPNIQTIVMDAAGNDILIPIITMFDWYNCKTEWYQWWGLSSSCKNLIDDLYVDVVNLLNNIDANGVENSMSILKKMGRERQKNIYLISHKEELASRVTNVLKVIKENGFTSYDNDVEIMQ